MGSSRKRVSDRSLLRERFFIMLKILREDLLDLRVSNVCIVSALDETECMLCVSNGRERVRLEVLACRGRENEEKDGLVPNPKRWSFGGGVG